MFVGHTMPLFRLFPGRPRCTFSTFTSFLGGMLFFWLLLLLLA